jgi:hypothetical protein
VDLIISTKDNFWLELTLSVVCIALALAPIGIICMQWRVLVYVFDFQEFVLFVLGAVCLVWSSHVLTMLAVESRHWRRRPVAI